MGRSFDTLTPIVDSAAALIETAAWLAGRWATAEARLDESEQAGHLVLWGQFVAPDTEAILPRDHTPTFFLDRLGDDLASFFDSWRRLHQDFAGDLAEGRRAILEQYLDQRCRRVASALEGLSESVPAKFDALLDQGQRRKLWAALAEIVPSSGPEQLKEVKRRLSSELKRTTMRQKLDSMIHHIGRVFPVPDQIVESVPAIIGVRNSRSHGAGAHRRNMIASNEIRVATQSAFAIYRCFIIASLDIPRSTQRELIYKLCQPQMSGQELISYHEAGSIEPMSSGDPGGA